MMMQRTRLAFMLTSFLLLFAAMTFAQSKEKFDFKFGKVTSQDFELPADATNKDDAAHVIADIGFSEFKGNNRGWFMVVFQRKVRIRINKADGVKAADFVIPLYRQTSATEKIASLKASAYNLENGQVVETVLKDDQIFTDKLSRNLELRKFSVPGAKAGALIEVKYTIESDYIQNLQPWTFQGEYPVYWSQYEVAIPDFFYYNIISQGYDKFHSRSEEQLRQTYDVMIPSDEGIGGRSQMGSLPSEVRFTRWAMKNLPALKEEPFTSSLSNHVAKIEFQLNSYRFPNTAPRDVMAKWPQIVTAMNNDEQFGYQLYKNNNFLDDEMKEATAGAATPEEKARRIYRYLQEKYTCTSNSGLWMTSNLKSIQKSKTGNVADINLLLVSMLNHEGIKATPVILSTRNHGFTHEFYPLLSRYNYVVALAEIGGKRVYLDATERSMPYGVLPLQCYNGHARIVADMGLPVYLMADSVTEKSTISAMTNRDESGEWLTQLVCNIGTYESARYKDMAREKGESAVKESAAKWVPADYAVAETKIDNLQDPNKNVAVRFTLKPQIDTTSEVIYVQPIFARLEDDNPFQSADRFYPVEMPYTYTETYTANIEIPEGYKVDEMPKSAKVNLNEDGSFEYLIQAQEDRIMLRAVVKLTRANFPSEDYEGLREFYSYIVKKQKESIVLKKISK